MKGAYAVTILARLHGRVPMRHLGRAFLERGVDKPKVGVILGLGVHAAADEALNGNLDGAHVHAAAQVEVLVQQVSCTELLELVGGSARDLMRWKSVTCNMCLKRTKG